MLTVYTVVVKYSKVCITVQSRIIKYVGGMLLSNVVFYDGMVLCSMVFRFSSYEYY